MICRSEAEGRFLYIFKDALSEYSGQQSAGKEKRPVPPCISQASADTVQVIIEVLPFCHTPCSLWTSAMKHAGTFMLLGAYCDDLTTSLEVYKSFYSMQCKQQLPQSLTKLTPIAVCTSFHSFLPSKEACDRPNKQAK